MPSDADRFRPHDRGLIEQSPVHPGEHSPSAFGADYRGPEQPAMPQQAMPQQAMPQQAMPPQSLPPAVHPHYAPPRFGAGSAADAPLIHPAAAQVSSITSYGVPVYRTPVYALPPQPARGLSITAFVLGLCSFVFAWIFVVVPIIGIVFGVLALRREPAGRTFSVIGLVTSVVGLAWVLLFYLLPLLAFFGAVFWSSTG